MKRILQLTMLFVIAFAMGCGGSGGTAASVGQSGSLTFHVVWPEPTRLIPIATKAITVTIIQSTTYSKSMTVVRGSAAEESFTFDLVPSGDLTVVASAFPDVDTSGATPTAKGNAVASGSTAVTLQAGQNVDVDIAMNSTIHYLDIKGVPADHVKRVGNTFSVTAAARTVLSVPVVVMASTLTWSSSDTSIATVGPSSGLVTILKAGDVTLRVTDSESGVTGSVNLHCINQVDHLVISPENPNIVPNETLQMTVTAYDTAGVNMNLPLTPDHFTCKSSDKTIATFSGHGILAGIKPGTVTLTVKELDSGIQKTTTATVGAGGSHVNVTVH